MMNVSDSDRVTETFFILLRAGLWGKEPNLNSFPLTVDEWQVVFTTARQQTVTGLVYQGVCLLPDKFLPPQGILLKWVAAVDAIERLNVRMNKSLGELYGLFLRNGLEPVLQKGQGIASLYDNPLIRECGDIDLYFTCKSDIRKALEIVRGYGCNVSAMSDGSYNFLFQNIEVEIHPFLVDISNPFRKEYIYRTEKRLGFVKIDMKGCDTEISVPSPFVNLILLNTHILKHALGWGIGVRQLCDMAMACYSLHDRYGKEDMKNCCIKLGIRKWTRLLNAFMADYLGMDEKYMLFNEREKDAGRLEHIVMKGGNFGINREGRKREGKSDFKSKIDTARSFISNMNIALRYAPTEGFWTFYGLVKGQL
ncbi:nucleotidyltransferase family protein [Bacteroides caecigallinarum]|uniref:nucleotidyltransferase family protein n=1 Tax=Bacteroides caecigallinarum TaxID=1411144 RepID=UPI00195A7FEA|nr:nucleotidyltransferase family protein [Bacteroides caecigallinarum]MBM6960808.1 nucleotidyltransferase family protein [Bacteroides caecigallinarum]